MKIIFSVLLPASLLICLSCKKEDPRPVEVVPDPDPVSCWTLPNRLVKNGESVTFQNCSQNYSQSLWSFGDGLIDPTAQPSHKWLNDGVYDVSLTSYTGTKTNVFSQKVYVGKKADITMTAEFFNWNMPAKYSRYQITGGIFRSTDLKNAMPEAGPYFAWPQNGPVTNLPSGKSGTAVFTDASSDYRLKLWFYGFTTNNGYEKLDSLITDDINVWTGPKKPSVSVNLGIVNVNYTLSTVRIY